MLDRFAPTPSDAPSDGTQLEREIARRRAGLKAQLDALAADPRPRARRRCAELRDELRRLDCAVDEAQLGTGTAIDRLRQLLYGTKAAS